MNVVDYTLLFSNVCLKKCTTPSTISKRYSKWAWSKISIITKQQNVLEKISSDLATLLLRFGEGIHFLGEQDFCFYYMINSMSMSRLTCSVTHWTCSLHETHRVCFAMLLLLLILVSRTPAAIIRHCRSTKFHKTPSSKENCYVSQIRINKPHWLQNGHTNSIKNLPTHDDAASLVELYTRACSDTIDLHARSSPKS